MALLKKDPYKVETAKTTKATGGSAKAVKANATTRNVGSNELSAKHLENMLKSDSPLMKLSETKGHQTANKRGLLNSSLAAGHAQNAMIEGAQPFALSDADAYRMAASENMAAQNEADFLNAQLGTNVNISNADRAADVSMFNAGAENETGMYNADQLNQARALGYSTNNENQQRELDRGFELQLLDKRLGFDAEQNALDRELQTRLQANDFSFRSGESELDRALQERLQELDQNFRSDMLGQEQEFAASQQEDQQDFAGSQADLDRQQQSELQQNEQAWRSGEAALDRQQQEWLQENEQEFAAAQAAMDRELDKYGIDKQRDNVLYGTIMDGMVTILSDPSIKKENKPAAINNLLTQARSAHDFAAQLADGSPSGGSGDSVAGGSGEGADTPMGAPYLNQLESELAGLYQQMEGTFPGQRGLMGRTALRAQIREKERQLEDYRASLA